MEYKSEWKNSNKGWACVLGQVGFDIRAGNYSSAVNGLVALDNHSGLRENAKPYLIDLLKGSPEHFVDALENIEGEIQIWGQDKFSELLENGTTSYMPKELVDRVVSIGKQDAPEEGAPVCG